MPRRHLDPRLLERLLQGRISSAEARDLARHLMDSCPDCAQAADLEADRGPDLDLCPERARAGEPEPETSPVPIAAASAPDGPEPGAEVDVSFDRIRKRLEGTVSLVFRQREEAPALLAEIERHPHERRRLLIRNNPRFQTLALAELLLERAWAEGLEEPAAGEELAALAVELVDQIDPVVFGDDVLNDLRGRSWAFRGNFRRIATDFRAAEEAFHRAEVYLADGSGDLLEQARLYGFRATLCQHHSRFDEARELLRDALQIYLATEEEHLAGRTLVKLGSAANDEGCYEEAIQLLEEGLGRIDSEEEPRILWVARQNLAVSLLELGRFEEAAAQLPTLRRMTAEHATRSDLLRLRWAEGRILVGLGHDARAEAAFLEVRKGFLDQGIGFDAAAVCLDLATLYLRLGRTAEIRGLVSEMLPIFQSRDVHRDAMAAFLLVQRAVEMETLTLRTIEEAAELMRRSQGKPLPGSGPGPGSS